MTIKATPLDGWEDTVPAVNGNENDREPMRCQTRSMPPDLQALLGARGTVDRDIQRETIYGCVRNIEGYTGTNGQPITTPHEMYVYGGKESRGLIAWLFGHIVAKSWTKEDLGESGEQPASS